MNTEEELMSQDLEGEIQRILFPYLKVRSNTGTRLEKDGEAFLAKELSSFPYFKREESLMGAFSIPRDPFDRCVCWGLVKGRGKKTVVLIHHYDVVDVEDYKRLIPLAYSPEELEQELGKQAGMLGQETEQDLKSGEWLFGRGTADMKGGGAIQLAILRKYSEMKDRNGNLLLIAVPDEENLSAGMRGAAPLLAKLKKEHGLDYVMMINSEPHQRKRKDVGVLSEGSVGKIMAFVYVRGYLSHVGKVFEGFNPVGLISRIVARTDLDPGFTDVVEGEAAPAPTWLFMKDGKSQYDVSMPLSASGCFSVLSLGSTPEDVMNRLEQISMECFEDTIENIKKSCKEIYGRMGKPAPEIGWHPRVVRFRELYEEARTRYGKVFLEAFEEKIEEVRMLISEGKLNILEGNLKLVETVYEYIEDINPRVVIGLAPPFYPAVANLFMGELDRNQRNLSQKLDQFAENHFSQRYEREHFFMGISDMSYSSISRGVRS